MHSSNACNKSIRRKKHDRKNVALFQFCVFASLGKASNKCLNKACTIYFNTIQLTFSKPRNWRVILSQLVEMLPGMKEYYMKRKVTECRFLYSNCFAVMIKLRFLLYFRSICLRLGIEVHLPNKQFTCTSKFSQ